MRIALLPLDERPVNLRLPGQVAAIAGVPLVTPSNELLPVMRDPGNADELAEWLRATASEVDASVVSLDMLGYGGLIGSRTSADPTDGVARRLGVLTDIRHHHPDLSVSAVTTVMRASRSYSPAEEPLYWSRHGVELHDLGAALHREFLGESHDRSGLEEAIPADVRADFWLRRMRNHAMDLYAIELAGRGALDLLAITADDTAPRAAGSLEQLWLRHWVSVSGAAERVLMYPGADEVGSVLVARAIAAAAGVRPRIAVRFCEAGGAERIAPYENVPIADGVARQIRAAGGSSVEDLDQADTVLVVHAPEPDGEENGAAAEVARQVSELIRDGRAVAVADVRRPNGSDPILIRHLAEAGVLDQLRAYGGWNTAGNTVGSVVAAVVAHTAGERLGTLDPVAQERLRWHRVVEDYGYQAVVRTELGRADDRYAAHISVPFDDADVLDEYVEAAADRLAAVTAELGGDARRWEVRGLRLPWRRTFEVDFDLVPQPVG